MEAPRTEKSRNQGWAYSHNMINPPDQATATPEKLEVHAKAKILQKYSWTAPTLVGTRLYVRDDLTLKCLDLGIAANQ